MSPRRHNLRLLYFTDSYPFGLGEEWKRVELEVFRQYFERIEVIPLFYAGNVVPKPPIDRVVYHHPLLPAGFDPPSRLARLAAILGHRRRLLFTSELLRQRAFTSKLGIDRWLRSSYFATFLSKLDKLTNLLGSNPESTVLYFFWARGTSEILPMIDTSRYRRTVLRLHGYDLYEEQAHGFIPYQREQLEKATDILPCSQHGVDYLCARYPEASSRVRAARLGAAFYGRAAQSRDGVLRVVSCSMMVSVKRLHLLAEAMSLVSSRVHWTHIGDGELFGDIQARVDILRARPNVSVDLLGRLSPAEVPQVYLRSPFDLFVNVSESEGLPVSIMEAFAAGIPACATAVGGTPEIVDEKCGRLLAPDFAPAQLAAELDRFAELDESTKEAMRTEAHAKFARMFDAERNAHRLAESIVRASEA